MAQFTAAVYGGTGFLGSEAIVRLLGHPEVELKYVYAADHIGEPVSAALPNLEGKTALRVSAVQPGQPPDVDILLLALPHCISHEVVASIENSSHRVIDMSGAFRVNNSDTYRRAQGGDHPLPHLLQEFVYGLPEVNRVKLQGARFVASPGCFATAIELGLLPLARSGWLSGDIQSVGITGSSGAGATPSVTTHHASRARNVRAYRPLTHGHVPEVEETLTACGARDPRVHFVPVAGPFTRGILVTSFAQIPAEIGAVQLREAYAKLSENPFVIHPVQRLPEVIAVAGSNFAEVGFALGEEKNGLRTISCLSAVDNLVKGGAGQAIENLNLMLGLPETLGLERSATFP